VTGDERGSGRPLLWLGSALSTLAALGVLPAAFLVGLRPRIGLGSSLGRHLFAGALGLGCLSLLLAVIAAGPLRRGEKWAFWAYAGALLIVGVPVVAADAIYVSRQSLLLTLVPEVMGLLTATAGLALCAQELFGAEKE
jgi:hypothetical protein